VFLRSINGGTAAILFCFAVFILRRPAVTIERRCHGGEARADPDIPVTPSSPAPRNDTKASARHFQIERDRRLVFGIVQTSDVLTLRTWGAAVRWVNECLKRRHVGRHAFR